MGDACEWSYKAPAVLVRHDAFSERERPLSPSPPALLAAFLAAADRLECGPSDASLLSTVGREAAELAGVVDPSTLQLERRDLPY